MKKRPLSRSITLVGILFIVVLSAVISVATYRIYTAAMFGRYQKQMASIVSYLESYLDKDDMSECAKTYVESEKYQEFQALLDRFVDYYGDAHYVYIMQVLPPGEPIRIREICTGNSTYEKEYEPDLVLHLGDGEEDWYTPEMTDRFYEILQGDEDVYLVNPSEWGMDYTLFRPLVDSAGNHFAMLCADVAIDELNSEIYRNIYICIGIILLSGLIFILLLLLWMHLNVSNPLKLLEKSVTDFAAQSTGRTAPDELLYDPPAITVRNEVRTLSEAVTKLTEDMRNYVLKMTMAEDRTKTLQTQAFQDALTKVKNKAAYDKEEESLDWGIRNGMTEFGIIMVDLNHLKLINDRYGHEYGNEYIKGSCTLLCDVFLHSPVFRVGGDEFIVVVQGQDYLGRDKLFEELKTRFASCAKDSNADPWHRYSAAAGMSVYQKGDTVKDVFNRADQAMYEEKSRIKAENAREGDGT